MTKETSQIDTNARQAVGHYINPESVAPTAQQMANQQIPQDLNRANSFYQYFQTLKNHPTIQAIQNTADPSKIPDLVYGKGNIDSVNAARMWLGDDAMRGLQSQFYQKLLDSPDISQAVDKYNKINPNFLPSVLNPEHLTALQTVDRLKSLSKAAHIAAKYGGTAAIGAAGYEAGRHVIP